MGPSFVLALIGRDSDGGDKSVAPPGNCLDISLTVGSIIQAFLNIEML